MNHAKPTLKQENSRVLGITLGIITLSLITWLFAFNNAYAADMGRLDYSKMTVEEVITTAPEFSTLASILPSTDLNAALMSGENITVFAQNNSAFAKLTTTEIESLISDTSLLNEILNLHWLNGRIYTGFFYNERFFSPDGMTQIPVRNVNTNTYIGNAKIVMSDIATRNGIIHIINEVVMPDAGQYTVEVPRNQIMPTPVAPRPTGAYSETIDEIYEDSNDGIEGGNLVETMSQYEDLSMLTDFIKEAGLADALAQSENDLTIFAPTNKAFGMLDNDVILGLRNNSVSLLQLLLNHVIPAKVTEDDMTAAIETGVSLNDSFLRFSRVNSPMVENARILAPNLEASNGVIHVIDEVINMNQ